MLQEHLHKLEKVALARNPSQATELLNSEPQKEVDMGMQGQTMNHTEEINGKHYKDMPKVDVRTVRKEALEPGTMREIIVQANLGHESAVLISPVRDLDSRHMCP